MARSVLLTAAQVAVFVNGNMYGRISNFSYSVETPRKKIHCVDSPIPFELATGVSSVSGTMGVWRMSQDGAAEGPGLVAPLDELTRERYFSLVLVDLTTATIIFQADFCSVESQTWSVSVKNLINGTIHFSALTYRNEVRPLG
jgi:hypothetical protein